jgi:hypothetical protein
VSRAKTKRTASSTRKTPARKKPAPKPARAAKAKRTATPESKGATAKATATASAAPSPPIRAVPAVAPDTLVDDLRLEAVAVPLGPATVLHLSLADGELAIALEQPEAGGRFAEATITVRNADVGGAMVELIAQWLGVKAPHRPAKALAKPPPYRLGVVWLQSGEDESGQTWQRTKLSFGGIEELFLLWGPTQSHAYLCEKDVAARAPLIKELAFALRDGVEPRPRAVTDPAIDPLRRDPVPLVTELVRMPVRPASVVGTMWRNGKFVCLERAGDTTAIVAIGLDRSRDRIATIDSPRARYLHAAGPHLIASAERAPEAFHHHMWLVSPGETRARLLFDDPDLDPGHSAQPVASPDGMLLAFSVRGSREGIGYRDSLIVIDVEGNRIVEWLDPDYEYYPQVWTRDGLRVLGIGRDGAQQYATWDGTSRELRRSRPPNERYTLESRGESLVVRDNRTGKRHTITPARPNEREMIEKYSTFTRNQRRVGEHYIAIEGADMILIDARTAHTWVVIPHTGAIEVDDAFELVALLPYGGGLLLGTIDSRWRSGEPAPDLDPAQIRAHLAARIEGSRFTFEGTRTNVVPADWASRVGLDEREVARRLEAVGRAFVASLYDEIEAALAGWLDDPVGAAARAASVHVPGSAGAVWGAIADCGAHGLDDLGLARLRGRLRELAATAFVRSLDHDPHVRALLGS